VAAAGEWHGHQVARRRRHGAHWSLIGSAESSLGLGLARSETKWFSWEL
jgi:hypothetical protein